MFRQPARRSLGVGGRRNKKRLVVPPLRDFGFAKTNFQIQNQAVFFSPRGAWQIVANSALSASPAGETTALQVRKTSENSEIVNWRYLLVEILTFFEQNPDWLLRLWRSRKLDARAGKKEGGWGEGIFARPRFPIPIFPPPNFVPVKLARYTTWILSRNSVLKKISSNLFSSLQILFYQSRLWHIVLSECRVRIFRDYACYEIGLWATL